MESPWVTPHKQIIPVDGDVIREWTALVSRLEDYRGSSFPVLAIGSDTLRPVCMPVLTACIPPGDE